jgi:hypothetical protein
MAMISDQSGLAPADKRSMRQLRRTAVRRGTARGPDTGVVIALSRTLIGWHRLGRVAKLQPDLA